MIPPKPERQNNDLKVDIAKEKRKSAIIPQKTIFQNNMDTSISYDKIKL